MSKQNKRILKQWRDHFEKIGLKDSYSSLYLEYISTLVENDIPVIFDLEHLSLLLNRSIYFLTSVLNATDSYYREFDIPKRKGGKRRITAPYPSLLLSQKWVLKNILEKRKVHFCAHAYIKNKSAISNAKVHLGQKEILRVDIKDFFPSITSNKVYRIFSSFGYTEEVSLYLMGICVKDGALPQGAPTSPTLSNIIFENADRRIYKLSRKFKILYSRYADDLVFSGSRINSKFKDYVVNILKDEGFILNENKTILLKGNSQKRIITGISVAGSKLTIPRDYKRKLKQELYFIQTYGLDSHVSKMKIKNPLYIQSLLGKINFWLAVEPNNETALSYRGMLKQYIN